MINQLAKKNHIDFNSDVKLTAMADYRLPQVLYNYEQVEGIIKSNEAEDRH